RRRLGRLEQKPRHARGDDHDRDRDQRDHDGPYPRARGAHVRWARPASAGNVSWNFVPLPGVLSTWIVPPLSSTMRWTNDNPNPEPERSLVLVVKNGSKIR